MAETSIEWTDRSINPLRAGHVETGKVGHYCEKVSPGCTNCYASTMQRRFGTPSFGSGQKRDELVPFLDDSKLREVLRRKKPTKWFWCDMSDMFGDWVPDEWIDRCFAVMALTQQHTHQVLTKRIERAHAYLNRTGRSIDFLDRQARELGWTLRWNDLGLVPWPLPNVWLGVSAEDQQRADERIPLLLNTQAAVRFVSAEPLLGPIDFHKRELLCKAWRRGATIDRYLDWIIVGGESGPKARMCVIENVDAIRQQCESADVALFIKQLGSVPITTNTNNWNFSPEQLVSWSHGTGSARIKLQDSKGGYMAEWPERLRVRQWPKVAA